RYRGRPADQPGVLRAVVRDEPVFPGRPGLLRAAHGPGPAAGGGAAHDRLGALRPADGAYRAAGPDADRPAARRCGPDRAGGGRVRLPGRRGPGQRRAGAEVMPRPAFGCVGSGQSLALPNPVNRRVPMSAGAIVAIIVAVVVVLLVIGALSVARRRKLQQRFG